MTREQWMMAVVEKARPLLAAVDAVLPDNVRASFSPPQRKMKAVGLCWHSSSSADEGREIWVSTEYDDPLEVAGILVHELCHAALPDGVAHKAPFKKLATKMGLEGKATATTIGETFKTVWAPILKEIGPLPGSKFTGAYPIGRRRQAKVPQKNVNCPDCGFAAKVRVDQIEMGRLRCPVDDEVLLFACEEV